MPTVEVNALKIYYEIHGNGEPLCLIPGLNNDITDYKKIVHLLSQRFKVIVLDNRGSGRTDKPDIPYSISMMSEDVVQLLSHLGIYRAHVVGISLGGRIATELVLVHPDMVKSLILVSTYVRRIESNLKSRRLNMLLRLSSLLGKQHHGALRQRDAARDYDATERLHEIHVPTLIVHGKKDTFAPCRFAEEMHSKIRGSRLITFAGGHMFLFFKADQFVDAITRFLGDIPPVGNL
ncbi:alpha/beta hydrolase [Alicyclobacillus fastidiosus]|uniref:Alpha/beta hydrolase n=1 Tax=Alicyclobacillus fastidiosus TaxID=392011 RepID=A0ABY6ZB11_9BACL|nr:alpha/beta hydrolase [Alicyclobacillus fastidiosus]WAH39723.1 alpha/beta hydrolase [Alicyclobacillus fastidiosus]GMA60948.1 3-oxoadipate enol-lactone hydrolase [Alicyclobacillus fastidiosus]